MKTKRFLAMLLVLAMVLSLVPATAWAEDEPKAEAGTIGVAGDDNPDDGIELDKVLTADDKGNYTLNLEAYVTGETSTVTQRTPTDITIVMDVSGSMDYEDMSTNTSGTNELYPYTMADATLHAAQGYYFYHKTENGALHEIEPVYIPNFTGTLYKRGSSSYVSSGTITGKDIYGYRCPYTACDTYSGYYDYGISYNGADVFFTTCGTCSPGAGNSIFNTDVFSYYWNPTDHFVHYAGSLEEAMAWQAAGNKFQHLHSDGTFHEVTLTKYSNLTGNLCYCSSSDSRYYLQTNGGLTNQDLYVYTCTNADCLINSKQPYAFADSDNSLQYYFTFYTNCDAGTGNDTGFYNSALLYWNSNKVSRIEAMQNAVSDFIDAVAKANEDQATDMQHRISMVKFAGEYFSGNKEGNDFYSSKGQTTATSGWTLSSAGVYRLVSDKYHRNSSYDIIYNCDQILNQPTYVTSYTATDLKYILSGLIAGGSTQANYGMQLANEIVTANKQTNPERRQIVLFFTDGEPTTGSSFENAVANSTIVQANSIKENAQIYAINISPADAPSADMLQYMYRVSSNYEGATSTSTGTEVSDKYYKAVANAQELADLFADIQQEIPGAAVELTDRADLRDYLADGVLLTDDTVITASVVPYQGNGTWGTPEPMVTLTGSQTTNTANGITLTVDRDTGLISATGFNYEENFVEDNVNGAANTYRGAKLLVTIQGINITEGAPVSPDGFIFTNKPESGVYTSTTSSRPADIFPMPYVTAANDNLYLDKKAGYTSDGTVTIDLEAFATGKTYSYQARKPVDITIVMDVSGSMAGDDWGEQETATLQPYPTYYSRAWAISAQSNGTQQFYHKTATGEYHPVTLFNYTDDPIYVDYGRSDYADYLKHTGHTSLYGYVCSNSDCKVQSPTTLQHQYRLTDNDYNLYTYATDFAYDATTASDGGFKSRFGLYYSASEISRMAAMQEAVKAFIDATVEQNKDIDQAEQHRISLIKFSGEYFPDKKMGNDFHGNYETGYTELNSYLYTAHSGTIQYIGKPGFHAYPTSETVGNSNTSKKYVIAYADQNCSQILSYSQNVNSSTSTNLKALVDMLLPVGLTHSHNGLFLANDVVTANKAESGRDQIVLFFTDGKPEGGDVSGFNTDYANQAIAYAKELKDSKAKVYTISLMKESEETADMKTFMQHASSNYPNATSLTEPGADGNEEKGYHLLASSIEDLNEIFNTITETVNNSETGLTAAATLRDYLAKGVELTEDSVITVHTVPYAGKDANGDRQWGTATEVQRFTCSNGQNTNTESGITVSADMTTGAVFVTGFDYESNYVGADENGNPKGQKLKVTITKVKVTEEAEINENGMIYTNKPESGVYPSDSETDEPAGLFPMPEVPDLLHSTHLDKKAELTDNGTYTITLDAYSTGQILNIQERNPVDITILMDVSNSMNSLGYREGESLLSTMQDAISNFLESIAASNQGCELSKQHRVGMAKFSSTASKVFDISYVNESTLDSMLTEVKNLTASGNTRTDLGATEAQTLIDNASPKLDRPQILILFSDGQPTPNLSWGGDGNDGGIATCNRALTTSAALKAQEVTVYSIALIPTDGITAAEKYQLNRFMARFSSNYSDVTSLSDTHDPVSDKYFMGAERAEDLTSIFADLTRQYVPSSAADLNGDAQLRDYLAEGFVLTDNTTVTVQSVAYEGNNNWSDEATTLKVWSASGTTGSDSNIAIEVNRETNFVGVSGFDYGANKVTEASYDEYGNQTAAPQGKKLVVTITGIEATDEAIAAAKETNDGFVPTNKEKESGLFPSENENEDPVINFPVPEVKLTSKIYVLDYAKEASLAAADWKASQANHLDADGMNFFESVSNMIDEKYGMVQRKIANNAYNNKQLYYTPQTMLWDGYDSFYSFGKQEDELTNLWSKISVLPANSVYYEDTFITTTDSSTVGITYTGSWTVANTGDNTEDENGEVHGWINDLSNDTGFSDGSAYGITLADPDEKATAMFKFTGTGADIYTYTDIKSGIVQAALMKVGENNAVSLVKVHIIDNLAVSGEYYQIPTLSFKDLEYGTYMVSLSVASAVAVDEDNKTVEGQSRSTYYLDGIRVYNPIQNLENDETVKEAYGDELSAIFQEVREKLLDAKTFDPSTMSDVTGTVFIDLNGKLDGSGAEGDTTDDMSLEEAMGVYNDYGPKHEVYLAPGQGIAFKVDAPDDAKFFLGIKSPAPTVNIKSEGAAVSSSQVTVSKGANKANITIGHSTDLYYNVVPNAQGYIFVMNTGDTLISITKLRSTGTSEGIVTTNAADIASYINDFRSLPVVDYVEQPLPPAEPAPEPSLWEVLAQIQKLLDDLFGSLDGWFNN